MMKEFCMLMSLKVITSTELS